MRWEKAIEEPESQGAHGAAGLEPRAPLGPSSASPASGVCCRQLETKASEEGIYTSS